MFLVSKFGSCQHGHGTHCLYGAVCSVQRLNLFALIFCLSQLALRAQGIELIELTTTDDWSATSDWITLTIWWSDLIYQCDILPSKGSSTFSCSGSDLNVIGDACEEYKIMLENEDSSDAPVIGSITVWKSTTIWYGIDAICIKNDQIPTMYGTNGVQFNWEMTTSQCSSGYTNYDAFCVDNSASGCAPGTIMLYFDETQPNSMRYDSPWEDASNVAIKSTTCSPTDVPSNQPTAGPSPLPTSAPTKSPSLFPSEIPTVSPTSNPSSSPTNLPTAPNSNSESKESTDPTTSPTMNPTGIPTTSPSSNPTITPTVIPTVIPTVSPTAFPTSSPTVISWNITTDSPSLNPSHIPSESPTYRPTDSTTTEGNEMIESDVFSTESVAAQSDKSDNDQTIFSLQITSNLLLQIIGVIILLILCCCSLLSICFIIKWRRKRAKSKLSKAKLTSINSMSGEGAPTTDHVIPMTTPSSVDAVTAGNAFNGNGNMNNVLVELEQTQQNEQIPKTITMQSNQSRMEGDKGNDSEDLFESDSQDDAVGGNTETATPRQVPTPRTPITPNGRTYTQRKDRYTFDSDSDSGVTGVFTSIPNTTSDRRGTSPEV